MFPIHLNLGFKVLYFYEGFYFLISILLSVFWMHHRFKKFGLDTGKFDILLFWVILGAILGARLSHFLFWEPMALIKNPLTFFYFIEGGVSIVGGILGGLIGGWYGCKKTGLGFWQAFAVTSPALLFGQALGRIGCFLNGDAHGIQSTLPWAMKFPKYGRFFPSFKIADHYPSIPWNWSYQQDLIKSDSLQSAFLHPTQLYEVLGDLVLMSIILILGYKWTKDKRTTPVIFFIHIGGYALMRFLIEFIRADREVIIFAGMSMLQIFLLLLTGLIIIIFFQKKIRTS